MQSSIRTIFDKLKSILKRAQKDGYKVIDISEVVVLNEDANAIYLTISEINKINEVRNCSSEMAAVKNRFLLGCFTALRYSDFSILTNNNIIGNNIILKTRKTGEKVVIPIHPIVRQILERNGGDFPKLHSAQAFNMCLKRLCKKAKINDEVLYERTHGTKVVRKRMKKYELITSHTARRSGATNMYLAGIPTARIMLLTGHKTEQAFFKYIRIEKEENAKTLSEHSFFK